MKLIVQYFGETPNLLCCSIGPEIRLAIAQPALVVGERVA